MKVKGFGRLVRDPELTYTGKGTALCKVSIAWNEKDRDESHFIDLVAWSKVAEDLAQCKKADALNIEGFLKQDKWTDKDGGKRSKHTITVMQFERYKSKFDEPQDDIPF